MVKVHGIPSPSLFGDGIMPFRYRRMHHHYFSGASRVCFGPSFTFRPTESIMVRHRSLNGTDMAMRNRHNASTTSSTNSPHPGRQMPSRSVQINHENDENVQTDTQLTNGKPFLIMLTIRHHPPLSFDAGHPFETP